MGSSTYQGGSHLTFFKKPRRKKEKLHRYRVHNHNFMYDIGEIHWRGGWRQYVFQAIPNIDMARSCHKVIDKFIDKLMKEWKEALEKKNKSNCS